MFCNKPAELRAGRAKPGDSKELQAQPMPMLLQQCGAQGVHMHILVVVCPDDEEGQKHFLPVACI